MTDRKEYKFKCGITAYQEEGTVRSDRELLKYFAGKGIFTIDLGDLKNFNAAVLLEKIFDAEFLDGFFKLILSDIKYPKTSKDAPAVSFEYLTRSEYLEVLADFFSLSKGLWNSLKLGKSTAASLLTLNREKKDTTRH